MRKEVKGYEGLYEMDELGNIWSIPRRGTWQREPRKLKHFLGEYWYVMLSKNGKTKKHRIHRLIAQNYIENPQNKPIVNHIDGDKWNNKIENLEWVTNSENIRHAYENGLISKKKGELNGNSKLSLDAVRQIRQIAAARGRNYGRKELAKKFRVSEDTIKSVVNKKTW